MCETGNFCKNYEKFQTPANGNDIHIYTKTQAPSMSKYTHISCGYGFTVLCTNHRELLVSRVMPRLSTSQFGAPFLQDKVVDKFKKLTLPLTQPDSRVLEMSCGRLHAVVSTTEGLFATGCNKLGQCGLGENEEATYFTRVPWSSSAPVKQVVCGLDHTLILTEAGDIWSCGWGVDGQTGLGHTAEQRWLVPVEIPPGIKIDKITTKADSCLALSKSGEVISWGNSEYCQLGFTTEKPLIATPTKVKSLNSIVNIAIGNSVGLALTDEGDVFTWGYGLLGNSSDECFNAIPQKLTFLRKHVVKIDCGLDYYVLETDDKEIYIWGKINRTMYSRLPKRVNIPSKITHISCGIDHMGVIIDGEI